MLPGEANGFKVDAVSKILHKYLRWIVIVLKTGFFVVSMVSHAACRIQLCLRLIVSVGFKGGYERGSDNQKDIKFDFSCTE